MAQALSHRKRTCWPEGPPHRSSTPSRGTQGRPAPSEHTGIQRRGPRRIEGESPGGHPEGRPPAQQLPRKARIRGWSMLLEKGRKTFTVKQRLEHGPTQGSVSELRRSRGRRAMKDSMRALTSIAASSFLRDSLDMRQPRIPWLLRELSNLVKEVTVLLRPGERPTPPLPLPPCH